MKTTPRNLSRFGKRLIFTAVLAGAWLTVAPLAVAQEANPPSGADQSATPGTGSMDSDVQAKARNALHQKEKELEAPKPAAPPTTTATTTTATNAPAKTIQEAPVETEQEDLYNWVELGVGGSIVNGDKAQYQRQSGLPANTAFGGIKSLHYEEPIGKKGLFTIDGRGIFDNHDYDLTLKAQHPEEGYVMAGYRQFREYYDGSGGYLPLTGTFYALPNNMLSLDRSAAFFEAALTRPDWPELKIRLEQDTRTGTKDSTEWGTTTLTPGAVQKKVTPAFRNIDEKDTWVAADITHTLGATDLGLGMRYDWIRNNDSLNVSMFPGQGTSSHTLIQNDGTSSDMFNLHAFTDSKLDKELEFTTGWAYTSMAEQIFGNRLDVPATTTAPDTRYANLSGASDFVQYEMDASLLFTPSDDLSFVPAFRVSKEDTDGWSQNYTVTGANVISPIPNNFGDNEARTDVAESFEARYSGLTNWVLYMRADWEQNQSDLHLTLPPPAAVTNDWHQNVQKYTAGANWYPQPGLNFAAQYYYKFDVNDYINTTATPTAYPGFMSRQNFDVSDANFRVTWRPLLQLTLVSRYDYQYTTIDMQGFNLQEIQSGNTTMHQVGETVSWAPFSRLTIQLTGNWVFDHTHTPAENATAPPGIVTESKNDYWTAGGNIGIALDNKSQLHLGYIYYRSDDYVDNTPSGGLPYGAGGEQHSASVSVDRQFTHRIRGLLSYNYTSYRDQLFAGHLDYQAHTILSSIQYRF